VGKLTRNPEEHSARRKGCKENGANIYSLGRLTQFVSTGDPPELTATACSQHAICVNRRSTRTDSYRLQSARKPNFVPTNDTAFCVFFNKYFYRMLLQFRK
jgi:hypothetical protein